jgi:hypothetical protein
MKTPLTLPQSLLLLTLKDESGRPKAGLYKPAIAGAGVSELLLRGLLIATEDKKPKLIAAPDARAREPFLDLILNAIANSEKQRTMQDWITRLGNHKDLIPTLAEELCKLGALTKETSKVFGLFTLTSWPEASPKLESNLKTELKRTIAGTGQVDERLSVIIALAKTADVLRHNFDRDLLKSNKARIKAITAGDLLATGATVAAVKAAQAAITAAIVVAAVIPTVTVS